MKEITEKGNVQSHRASGLRASDSLTQSLSYDFEVLN